MNKTITNYKDIISLFLGIVAIHMYVISLTTESFILMIVSLIDSLIAFLLGIGTDSDYGHGGLIIGMIFFLVSLLTIFVI